MTDNGLPMFGFLLIFEGILPFAAPNFWRKMVLIMASRDVRTLRISGFICMLLGLIILVIAHLFIR